VRFKLNPSAGQALYVQLMQQIRHGIETGVLQEGDLLPGIRTLAEELVVSHNTVAKAYSELEHDGCGMARGRTWPQGVAPGPVPRRSGRRKTGCGASC